MGVGKDGGRDQELSPTLISADRWLRAAALAWGLRGAWQWLLQALSMPVCSSDQYSRHVQIDTDAAPLVDPGRISIGRRPRPQSYSNYWPNSGAEMGVWRGGRLAEWVGGGGVAGVDGSLGARGDLPASWGGELLAWSVCRLCEQQEPDLLLTRVDVSRLLAPTWGSAYQDPVGPQQLGVVEVG